MSAFSYALNLPYKPPKFLVVRKPTKANKAQHAKPSLILANVLLYLSRQYE